MTSRFGLALSELGIVLDAIDPDEIAAACEMIATAGRIVAYGCGREGLQLRGLVMRLHHLGLRAAMQGDMAAPPVGKGDLLLVSAGPGELPTVTALMRIARDAGAEVLFVTAQPRTPSAVFATRVLTIPAQTMASDRGEAATSILPMGSLFEGAMFLLFEIMVLDLRGRLGVSPEDMRARHTNLE
ncbi:6-phospho-3-hexuloisomerase [Ostreiculturibacter nitratireducens]|uniref:6-phospho-3-hexuloisomerase n=1 Tax=Ostreiculturibacter nitratireducens TaxID=3075226 RepID=UPI0031B58525